MNSEAEIQVVKRQKKEYATLTRTCSEIKNGRIVTVPQVFDVEVMARAKGYAMVRRKGCAPFVASERLLTSVVA